MKSPITGKIMRRENERRKVNYRKDSFDIVYQYYVSEDSGEKFTDEEIDNLNLKQVYNQYRFKYGIPFTDEIKALRSKYGLSAAKMSEVLGLGANVFRQYEAGEMPSVATGRLIRMSEDPQEFKKLVEMSKNVFEKHEFERVQKKLEHFNQGWEAVNEQVEKMLFVNKLPDVFNGFKVPSMERAGNMVRFFAHNNKPFTTALNKLMFYADFGHYKIYGNSISGISYKAMQKGPVPVNYNGIYNQVVNKGYAEIKEVDFNDFVGEQFSSKEEVEENKFTEAETNLLKKVSERFKKCTTKQIVNLSHSEKAWQENVDGSDRISYEYSFELKHLEK